MPKTGKIKFEDLEKLGGEKKPPTEGDLLDFLRTPKKLSLEVFALLFLNMSQSPQLKNKVIGILKGKE